MDHVQLLQQLADKLGLAVDHLWPHAVRYTVISNLLDALLVPVWVGFGILLWRKMRDVKDEDAFDRFMKHLFLWIGVVVCILCGLGCLSNVAAVIEPEGYLVQQILRK